MYLRAQNLHVVGTCSAESTRMCFICVQILYCNRATSWWWDNWKHHWDRPEWDILAKSNSRARPWTCHWNHQRNTRKARFSKANWEESAWVASNIHGHGCSCWGPGWATEQHWSTSQSICLLCRAGHHSIENCKVSSKKCPEVDMRRNHSPSHSCHHNCLPSSENSQSDLRWKFPCNYHTFFLPRVQ